MTETERTTIEATGPDAESAISAGLDQLDVSRDEVKIEVLDEGSRGMLGFGAREARVRLTVTQELDSGTQKAGVRLTAAQQPTPATDTAPTPTPVPPQPDEPQQDVAQTGEIEIARGALTELLSLMSIDQAQIDVHFAEPEPGEKTAPLVCDVRGPGTDDLIGRRGETLAALQYITRLIVGQEMASRVSLVIDVGGFKARRAESLRSLAQRLAEQAVRTNRTVVLEPMPPHERRIIHLSLREDPHVITESVGEGERRKVTIIPQR